MRLKMTAIGLMLPVSLVMAQETPSGVGETRSGVAEVDAKATLPIGLSTFLDARQLEAAGLYSEALDRYAEALREAPDSVEVRVRYASLLSELGLVDTAVTVLEGQKDLDWYGLRTRALAMAQMAGHRKDMLEPAEQALRAVVDERADDGKTWMALAQVLDRQGRLEEAQTIVRDMVGQRGGQQRLIVYQGSLLRRLGRLEEAAAVFGQCVAMEPPLPACREELVEVLVELERPAEAGEAMLTWLGNEELDELLRAASLLSSGGKVSEALTVVRRVLAAAPDSQRARSFEAYLLSAAGRLDEAAERFRRLLKEEPDNFELQMALASTEARRNKLDEAREILAKVWERTKGNTGSAQAATCCLTAARIEIGAGHHLVAREWLENLGDPSLGGVEWVRLLAATYRFTQQWREGVEALLRVQPRLQEPARTEAIAYEAELRLRLGESEQAMRRLRPLLDSVEKVDTLVALQVLQNAERWADIAREAEELAKRFPGDRDIRFSQAAAYERLGRRDDATALLEQLVGERGGDAASANYLGYMWADAGVRLADALRLIQQAVELEPDNGAYVDSLGWVHYRLGNLQEAERWLRRAVELSGGDGTVLSHLGEVLLANGQNEEARLQLGRALELDCERPEHVRQLLEGIKE